MIFAPSLNQRIQDVLEACANEWECNLKDLLSKKRTNRACVPRHAAMKIMRTMGMSLHEVAGVFNRHHTAGVHAVEQHGKRMEGKDYLEKFNRITK